MPGLDWQQQGLGWHGGMSGQKQQPETWGHESKPASTWRAPHPCSQAEPCGSLGCLAIKGGKCHQDNKRGAKPVPTTHGDLVLFHYKVSSSFPFVLPSSCALLKALCAHALATRMEKSVWDTESSMEEGFLETDVSFVQFWPSGLRVFYQKNVQGRVQ